MVFSKDWAGWWGRFLGFPSDRDQVTIEVLRQRYVDEMHGISQLTQHAGKMHYRQFRDKLVEIAAGKSKHAEWIGEKIIGMGAELPELTQLRSTEEVNSWQYLLTDLAEEKRSADLLPEQIWRIGSDHPEISDLLQRISDTETSYRQDITDMIVRSDGFALSLA